RRTDQIEYEAIMDRNEAVFYAQYGDHMRDQEEEMADVASAATASAAAANAGTPEFTFSVLGLEDPAAFNNFMRPDPPADE
ncbi:hypothetical protein A2U01_0042591, partial [Trifolium medium]|nr:hypothetical protein [Trifolium medium]